MQIKSFRIAKIKIDYFFVREQVINFTNDIISLWTGVTHMVANVVSRL